jgi:hypothetical protein
MDSSKSAARSEFEKCWEIACFPIMTDDGKARLNG